MTTSAHILGDARFTGIPWKDGARNLDATPFQLDCAGLAMLWLREERGLEFPPPACATPPARLRALLEARVNPADWRRGDVVFFEREGVVCHVAVCVSRNRLLTTLHRRESVIIAPALLARLGYTVAGVVAPDDAPRVAAALNTEGLGEPATIVLAIISIALSVASAFLMPRPKLGAFRNESGRYGFDQLWTQNNPQLPLPDILGGVVVAGNSPFQSLIDESQEAGDATQQKVNKVVVLCGGPIEDITLDSAVMKINGRAFTDTTFHASGFAQDPAQTKAEAVDGTINSEFNRPSFSFYPGTHDIEVPVDVRAQYDRNFPLYGFSGCAYLAFRLIGSAKFAQFNVNIPVSGRLCRTFDEDGFVRTTVTDESLAGADGSKVRFKLDHEDIASIASVTVDGDTYLPISADDQSGDVYHLNATKGFIEFVTAPGNGLEILITYDYFPREWTRNPASHVAYLLTEPVRGRGFAESKLNWERFAEARDFYDEEITWQTPDGPVIEPRFRTNYSLDARKPIGEHIRAILDGCLSYLFISDGKFVLKPRTSGDSVFDFDETNIKVVRSGDRARSTFSSELVDRSTRANRVNLFFMSDETYNVETGVVRDDMSDQRARADRAGNLGIVDETVHLPAVTSTNQAARLAETMIRENIAHNNLVELTTNRKGIALEPGDIVTLTHPSRDWDRKEFRVEDLSLDPDGDLVVRLSEYEAGAYIS